MFVAHVSASGPGTRIVTAFVLVGLGGVLGANTRYFLSVWAANRFGVDFPYGTFLINGTGSLGMGLVITILAAHAGDFPEARLLLTTGFLSAYTTFSTFTYESVALLRRAEIRPGLVNVFGSTLIGIGGCIAGIVLGELVMGWLA